MAPTLFRILLGLVALYALLRGSSDERYVGAICVLGALATHFVISPLTHRFRGVETSVMIVDLAVFAGFLLVALRSRRFWPLWVAGLQLTTIFGHLLKLLDIQLVSPRLWRRALLLGLPHRPDPGRRHLAASTAGAGRSHSLRLILCCAHNAAPPWEIRMSRRKKSHQSHGTPNRPRLWGKHAVAAALDNPQRKVLRAWATREAAGFMQFPKDVAVTLADVADLGRLVPHDAPHQGVVIEVEALDDHWLDDLLTGAPEKAVLLVLDQVTDPHNVGAILRSAAAFGAIGIVTQDRHSPPESGVVAKAASGALERVPWARVVNLARALEEIGDAGFWRIGLTGDAETELKEALGPARVALVLGAEGPGLRPNTREHCDALARLPISDAVESLNVSNAAAVALYAASTN